VPWGILQLDWHYCLAKYAESDGRPCSDEYQWYYDDPDAPDWVQAQIKVSRDAAAALYKKRVGSLHSLRFMTPAEYDKHYSAGLSREQITRSSKNGDSLCLENYSGARLQDTFWSWFHLFFDIVTTDAEYMEFVNPEGAAYSTPEAKLWRRFLGSKVRICMNTLQPVGASKGELTSFLCYEVNIDGKFAHCYPVPDAEAKRIMGDCGILIIDALNS
jgi:hypothetical protein